jgi:hypothetical protein
MVPVSMLARRDEPTLSGYRDILGSAFALDRLFVP